MNSFGSLRSLKILDLTQMLAGPFGTMMLADHGAEVIKIESPDGDLSRTASASPDERYPDFGAYFQSVNRNKKSIILNLRKEEDRAKFYALVKEADAVIESYRPGVADRLGLGYEKLNKLNPRLVYASLSGFGNEATGKSPYSSWPAFDIVAQAQGGIMGMTGGEKNLPTKIGPGVGDIIPGMQMAFGVVSAILRARETGKGQWVDVSMVDGILAVCERMVYQKTFYGQTSEPEGNHHPFLAPYGVFRASDGFVAIAAQRDDFFATLCNGLELPELITDERFCSSGKRNRNRPQLLAALESRITELTTAELKATLGGKVPFGVVQTIDDILEDEHFAAREMLVDLPQPGSDKTYKVAGIPIKMTETPGKIAKRAPLLGEHNEEILGALQKG